MKTPRFSPIASLANAVSIFIFLIFSTVLSASTVFGQNDASSDSPVATAASASFFSPVDSVVCDVCVVGAGSAGIPAAVQSGRLGAKTLLLEINGQPGGNATSGGVNFPGLFHAWGKQVISGIGWEWVEKTVELGGGTLPDFTVPTGSQHWKHQIRVEIATYVAVAEELCADAGVELRYYETPCAVEKLSAAKNGGANWRVTTVSQGEFREIVCRQLIDCTGNGALCALLGAQRLRESETQPGTFNYQLDSGIDVDRSTAEEKAEIERRFADALKSGELEKTDVRSGVFALLRGDASNYVVGADSSTGKARTETNLRARRSALRTLRFVRTLPGGENARLTGASPEVGVRETYRVRCEYEITRDDYVAGKIWDDSLAFAFYPIDLHSKETGVQPAHLKEGVVATIPLRALIPSGFDNVLVAGRCIGSDRLANSALRVQATCMSGGQAAGAAAALAAKSQTTPANVGLQTLKETLRQSGAIVP